MQYTISALVANKSGVLMRVSSLFSRRAYNIDSLSVCATEDPTLSRMTIVLNGDDYILGQMMKQMDKLIDVKKIIHVDESDAIFRELLLLKVNAPAEKRAEIYQICEIFRAKVDDLYPTSMVIELTGESRKLDGFINMVKDYGILEMARTGVTAISRGDHCIKDMIDYNEKI
jgi:acetolactate synthase-1/3 small subunit